MIPAFAEPRGWRGRWEEGTLHFLLQCSDVRTNLEDPGEDPVASPWSCLQSLCDFYCYDTLLFGISIMMALLVSQS